MQKRIGLNLYIFPPKPYKAIVFKGCILLIAGWMVGSTVERSEDAYLTFLEY